MVRYCIADPQNAIRFNEDVQRDIDGLDLALKKMAEPASRIPGALEALNWTTPEELENVRATLSKQTSILSSKMYVMPPKSWERVRSFFIGLCTNCCPNWHTLQLYL